MYRAITLSLIASSFLLIEISGQHSTINTSLSINETGDDAKPGCLLDLSESKKACKIPELNQAALSQISDCTGALVYNSDSLRYETLINYTEVEQIGNLAVNQNSSAYEYGPNNLNKPYLFLPYDAQIDSVTVYLTNCTANISTLIFLFRTYAQGECTFNNFIREGVTNNNSINNITFNDWNTFTFLSPIQLDAFERIHAFFLAPAQNFCNGKFSSPASINGLGSIDLNNCQEQENNEPSFIWHISRSVTERSKLN